MSKIQKSRAKLGSLIRQVTVERAAVRSERKRVGGINDVLNATIVEQNERLGTLAGNCAHYRQRIQDLTDRLATKDDEGARQFAVDVANGTELTDLRTALRKERIAYSKVERERDALVGRLRNAKTMGFMLAALAIGQAWPRAWEQIQPLLAQVL